ncbi:MBL fold metallo-hydrolase [Roseibacillus persicicus]|uniref:MBL fold metallo-hydrolase n=1 Tax=Roseibacillus persicicus TaxID=454148 RepID=UPI001672BB59|nr:MBL fold metallo-hydrolase [Roseibacillus persicicus]
MPARLTFLGTGTSVGVPVIGCDCAVCTSTDPRNRRTRSSIVIHTDDVTILVDTGPDLREQALREGLTSVDHVLYTHDHVDHVVGFDEIRAFCWRREDPMPLHGSLHTLNTLERMFPWAFGNTARNYVRPAPKQFDDFDEFEIGDVTVRALPVHHGVSPTHGFRFTLPGGKSIGYLPDVKVIPPESRSHLKGLDLLIIDALRDAPHSTHMSLAEALEAASELQPVQTALTHLTHDLDFVATSARLPSATFIATDGLTLDFSA